MVDEKVCCHSNSQVVSDGIIDLRWYKLFVKLLILLLFVLISTLTGDVDAKGYYRSDGTYVPVATFAIGSSGSKNAALFAIRIIALEDDLIANKLDQYIKKMEKAVPENPK